MSEILFRGIAKKDRQWVYGAYCPSGRRGFIVNVGIDSVGPIAYLIEVYPETVGQFTGLYDATKWEDLSPLEQEIFFKDLWEGRQIFEGDILEAHYDDRFPEDATRTVVVWNEEAYDNHGIGWYIDQKPGLGDPLDRFDAERNKVIGNIHENRRLLEEESGWQ